MSTQVYGTSDDLIEFEGDVRGEVGHYSDEKECMLIFDDGTILLAIYGKANLGIWKITLLKAGLLFDRIETCEDENADRYSDTAHFKDGLKWAYSAKEWEKVN